MSRRVGHLSVQFGDLLLQVHDLRLGALHVPLGFAQLFLGLALAFVFGLARDFRGFRAGIGCRGFLPLDFAHRGDLPVAQKVVDAAQMFLDRSVAELVDPFDESVEKLATAR